MLFEGLKWNKTLKQLNISSINQLFSFFNNILDSDITSKGMKEISTFLSREDIVIEELDMGLIQIQKI